MAISGTWASRYADSQAYTGALRWGTGYNPVHEVRDNPGRVIGTRENLYPLGQPSDAPPDSIIGPDDFTSEDWCGAEPYPDEVFRYQETRPRWGESTVTFRDESNSDAMGEQPPWGVYYDADDTGEFPWGGPTGGTQDWIDVSHGENIERQHAVSVPTGRIAGGWRNKYHAVPALESANDGQDPGGDPLAQWAVNTGKEQGQGVKSSSNDRATARGTDRAREPIQSRTAGMRQYVPATSFGMGGGAGTPDMYPVHHTAGLKRPFVPRRAGLPPEEDHYWNEMEGRTPIQRTVPPDPYQGDPETAGLTGGTDALADEGGDWGY